jgi:short-subunit dehydrogenase
MFETNVFGLIRVTQAVLPSMRERRRGTIINISSIAGRVPFPRSGFYSATKWAVEAISESLYYEVRPFGLQVIVIEPGAFATDFGPRSAVRSPSLSDPNSPYAESAQKWTAAAAVMMPRRQDPAEVVEAVIAAARRDEPFQRVPVGPDAVTLVHERFQTSEADFIGTMTNRYYAR